MITVSDFRENFYAIFRLMKRTGMYVDIQNRGHVYRIHVEDLKIKTSLNYKNKQKKSLKDQIKADNCPVCNKLMINDVCMNPTCPTLDP